MSARQLLRWAELVCFCAAMQTCLPSESWGGSDPLVGYLVLDTQSNTNGTLVPTLTRYDTSLVVVWRTGLKFDDLGMQIPETTDPNSVNIRSMTSIAIGSDGFIYAGSQGTDNLGERFNLATGYREVRFKAAENSTLDPVNNPNGGGIAGMAFGPDLNGNGTDDLYISTRSGIEVHDVMGQPNALIQNGGGLINIDLSGGTDTTPARIHWSDHASSQTFLFGNTLPNPSGANDRWAAAVTRGPDMNGDTIDDMNFVISTTNPPDNNGQFVAVMSGADLSVIKTIKTEWSRRAGGIAFDNDGNMYITGQDRDHLNVHIGAVSHDADAGDPEFFPEADARFVKIGSPLGDVRPDNGDSLHFGKDGRLYLGSRFGYRSQANVEVAADPDPDFGAALIYDIDSTTTPGVVQAGGFTVLMQGENSSEPGYFPDLVPPGSRIRALLPIFASDLPPEGVLGDYNDNGTIDAADYVVWRNAGPTDTLLNDPTPGTVDQSDYDFWRSRFGATSGSGSIAPASSAAVPEPASLLIALIGAMAMASRRRNWQRGRCQL